MHFGGDVVGQRIGNKVLQRLFDVAVGDVELRIGRGRLARRRHRKGAGLLERKSRRLLVDRRRLRQVLVISRQPLRDLFRIARIAHPELIAQHVVDGEGDVAGCAAAGSRCAARPLSRRRYRNRWM